MLGLLWLWQQLNFGLFGEPEQEFSAETSQLGVMRINGLINGQFFIEKGQLPSPDPIIQFYNNVSLMGYPSALGATQLHMYGGIYGIMVSTREVPSQEYFEQQETPGMTYCDYVYGNATENGFHRHRPELKQWFLGYGASAQAYLALDQTEFAQAILSRDQETRNIGNCHVKDHNWYGDMPSAECLAPHLTKLCPATLACGVVSSGRDFYNQTTFKFGADRGAVFGAYCTFHRIDPSSLVTFDC